MVFANEDLETPYSKVSIGPGVPGREMNGSKMSKVLNDNYLLRVIHKQGIGEGHTLTLQVSQQSFALGIGKRPVRQSLHNLVVRVIFFSFRDHKCMV